MTPNKENIRKWIVALRSKKYEQGAGALCSNDRKFCCLGVACELFRIETGGGEWVNTAAYETTDMKFQVGKYSGVGVLPLPVALWLGFVGDGDPQIGEYTAIECNDKQCLTFEEIAQLIENTYLTD